MRDLLSWSLPLGRLFGIPIKVHVLFPVVAAGLILRVACDKDAPAGIWIDASMVMGLLFLTVLLHELGHCAGGRYVDGDAREILLWPLGGLASVDVPHTPRANLITALAGPAANLLICLAAGVALVFLSQPHISPPWNPLWYPYRFFDEATKAVHPIQLNSLDGLIVYDVPLYLIVLARLFWVSWILFLVNMVLIGFPMDGGRVFQCILWYRFGYRQATLAAVCAGFIVALVLGVISIVINQNAVLVLGLALFIGYSCHRQWFLLETGGEDSPFGYDFSQGYTSLERDQPPTRRRQPSLWKRWWQRRAQVRQQREEEQRELEERRMDELLEKVQRLGLQGLTDEERRFLTRVSAKYRNRQ
jgi:stage IV sporulation protein FB